MSAPSTIGPRIDQIVLRSRHQQGSHEGGATRRVEDALNGRQLPKLEQYPGHLFIVACTAEGAALSGTVANVRSLTERLNAPGGALGVLMGNEGDAKKIVATLDRTNQLLARIDGMAAKADKQVFGAAGDPGLVPEVRATVVQLNGLLADTRQSLKKVDAVLAEAQAIGANTREATNDLGTLRAEVEANLRKVEGLVNDIQRKWPFARDTELKLP